MKINGTVISQLVVGVAVGTLSVMSLAQPASAAPVRVRTAGYTSNPNASHNKLYPVLASVTGRTNLDPAEYADALADLKSAAAWWGTQTNGVITFTVSDSTPTVSIPRESINFSAVEGAASDAGYNLADPTQIPVVIFPRHISAYRPIPENGTNYSADEDSQWSSVSTEYYQAATAKSDVTSATVAWDKPIQTRRTSAAIVYAPWPMADATYSFAHELGHTLGLDHSLSLMADRENLNTRWISWEASKVEDYGDRADIMGRMLRLSSATRSVLGVPRAGLKLVRSEDVQNKPLTMPFSGAGIMWDDTIGAGKGTDQFFLETSADGPTLERVQRTYFSSGWTTQVYAMDPGTDALAVLMKGHTYLAGGFKITILTNSTARFAKA